MDRATQAQIARVIFEDVAAGKEVTAEQKSQLAAFIRGKWPCKDGNHQFVWLSGDGSVEKCEVCGTIIS